MDNQRDEQADEIYQAIGRYIVEFSQMMLATEFMIRFLVPDRGVGVAVILAGLDASHLTRSFFSLCALYADWTDHDRAIVKALRREVNVALETRNRVAHDVWFVGWGHEDGTDWSTASRIQAVAEKTGYARRDTKWTVADIEALTDDLSRLRELIQLLGWLSMPDSPLKAALGAGPAAERRSGPADVMTLGDDERTVAKSQASSA